MDTKRLLTTMLIVGAAMLLFQMYFNRGGGSAKKEAYSLYANIPPVSTAREADATADPIILGSATDQSSTMAITITPQTAGIEKVELNIHKYAETIKRDRPMVLFEAKPRLAKPFSTLGVHIGLTAPFKPYHWELSYGKGISDRIAKRFEVLDAAVRAGTASAEDKTEFDVVKDLKTKNPEERIASLLRLMYQRDLTADETKEFTELQKFVHEANSTNVLDSQYIWQKTRQTATDVDFTMNFTKEKELVARVVKTFHVDPASYEISISHTVQNLTNQSIKVQIDQLGPQDLPRDDPQMDDRYFHGAVLDVTTQLVESTKGFNATQAELVSVTDGTKAIGQFNNYGAAQRPGLWIASSNRFFAAVVRPLPGGDAKRFTLKSGYTIPEVTHVASANLDVMKWSELPNDLVAILRLTGDTVEVLPQGSVTQPLSVYLGPKQRSLLEGNERAAVDSIDYSHGVYQYISIIQLAQGCYTMCTFDWLAWAILGLLDFFKNTIAFGNYGVAIMILVIVVRAALHPLTRASQINMAVMGKKMKDVQPQIEAAKKKYPTNKQKQTEETMRIYRENKVNPAGGILGCLPMLVQMPIWAALWSGIRADIDLRHAPFIPGWINDLSHPDTIFPSTVPQLGHPYFTVPLIGMEIYGLNLLPILLTVVFFFQMKVTTASQPKPADEQQAQMQKMSQYMIFIFPLFLYCAPSGLNLYIFASTMGGLVDTWLVRKTLKKKGILPATAQTLPTHEEKSAS